MAKMKRKLILFMLFTPFLNYGQYGRWANNMSFYWGTTYRLKNSFYNSFDISYEKYSSSCTRASYKGIGIRLDNFNSNNYSVSIKYFHSLARRPDFFMIPYWSISPGVFSMMKHIGLNLKA